MADIQQGVRINTRVTGREQVDLLNKAIDTTMQRIAALNGAAYGAAGVGRLGRDLTAVAGEANAASGALARLEAEVLGADAAANKAAEGMAVLAGTSLDAAAAIEIVGGAAAVATPLLEALAAAELAVNEKSIVLSGTLIELAASIELAGVAAAAAAPLFDAMATAMAAASAVAADLAAAMNVALSNNLATLGATGSISAIAAASEAAAIAIELAGIAAAEATPILERFIAAEVSLGDTSTSLATVMETVGISIELAGAAAAQAAALFDMLAAKAAAAAAATTTAAGAATAGAGAAGVANMGGKTVSATAVKNMTNLGVAADVAAVNMQAAATAASALAVAIDALGVSAGAAAVAVSSLATACAAVAAALQAMAQAAIAAAGATNNNTNAATTNTAALVKQGAAILGVNSQLVKLAAFAGKVLLPIAAAVTMGVLAKNAVEMAADLEKLHQRMGISVEDLSVLKMAADQVGISMDQLAMGMRMFDRHVDEAVDGRGKLAIAKFKEIGMTMDDLKHKAPIDLFLQFANAIAKIEDPTVRSATATILMGRASEKLIPLMNVLANGGFAKAAEEAQKLGVVVSSDQAKAALEFEKSWAKVKLSLEGVGVSILGAVVPALQALAEGMTFLNTDPIGKWANPLTLIAVALKAIVSGFETIFGWVEKIGVRIGTMAGGLVDIAQHFGNNKDAELGDRTKQLLGQGKLKSTPGGMGANGLGLLNDDYIYGQRYRQVENKWADKVGAVWGIGGPPQSNNPNGPFDRGTDQVDKAQQALQVAKDQLAVAQAQARVAESDDNFTKLKLEHAVKLLEIQKQLDQHLRSIPKDTDKDVAKEIADQYRASAAAQRAAENATYNQAIEETTRKMTEQTRALKDQLAIQQMQIGSEGAIADNVKEQISYATKLAQIEDERKKNIAGIDPKDHQRAQLTSLYNQQAATQALETELAHQAAVEATARAQAEEMRSLTTTANESERVARIAQLTADLELQKSATIQTQATAEKIAYAQRLIAEQEFQAKRTQIAEEASKKIADQQAIIEASRRRIEGNVDGVVATEADYDAIKAATARITQLQRTANAQIVAERVKTDAQIGAIDIAQQQSTQAAINALRGDAYAAELAMRANELEKLGTWEASQHARVIRAELKQYIDMLDAVRSHWKALADEMSKSIVSVFDVFMRGGKFSDALKSVGQGFSKLFEGDIQNRIKEWIDQISNAAQGIDANGNTIAAGQPGAMGSPQQQAAQRKLNAANIAGAGLAGYSAGQGNGAATATAAAAFISGLSSGNIYVAVAAAVVSLIGSALGAAQKRKDYQYGMPYFTNGEATLGLPRNLTDAKITELTASLQKAFNDAFNGMQNILLKITGGNFGGLGSSEIVGVPQYLNGKFQDNPSAHWAEHFQTYLSDTLPRDVAQLFYNGMKAAFTNAMGMLVHGPITEDVQKLLGAQFDRFWQEASKLDSSSRQQFWSDMADGFIAFTNAATKYNAVVKGMQGGGLANIQLDANGWQHQFGDSDFVTQLKAGTQGIFDQARAMVSLTGPDRVAAFKALGQSIDKVTGSLVDYINHIADVLRNVGETFHDAIYQHNLERAGEVRDANGNVIHQADPNAQARLMEQEYNRIVDRIMHAKDLGLTADDVNNLTNTAIGLLNSIYALDPTDAADKWWQTQMTNLNNITTNTLNGMGQAARDAVSKLLAEVQPFVDWFNGLPVDLDAAMKLLTGPDGAFAGFADALDALTQKIKDTTPPTTKPGPGDGGPDKPGPGGGEKNKENSIGGGTTASSMSAAVTTDGGNSYNFYFGHVYGVDDLQDQIKSAVRSVARNSPTTLRRDYT